MNSTRQSFAVIPLFTVIGLAGICKAAELSSPSIVVFHDKELHEPADFSSVARVGEYLVVGSDEGHVIQVLEEKGQDTYKLERKYSLPDGNETERINAEDPEFDVEGIAASGETIYIVGSHSRKRKKVEIRNPKRRSHSENRERLEDYDPEGSPDEPRRRLFKCSIDSDGKLVGDVESGNLWEAIHQFDLLKPFTKLPSKENGIDIEGIAAQNEHLYIGFRGPVLRENWVPVLVTQFDDLVEQAELRFVNLGGLGIRDMISVSDEQFLLIAGPMGDGPGGYHLYSWNGLDCIPGKNGAEGHVQHLGEIPTGRSAKAEGVALLPSHQDGSHRIIIVFDGPERGDPVSFMLKL